VKVWYWNAKGVIVLGNIEVKDLTEARVLAKDWNTDPGPLGRVVWITLDGRFTFENDKRFAVEAK
jgi:hypothetical protein